MRKTKRIFLTMVSACMLFMTIVSSSNTSLFAQPPNIESTFEEKLSEDKTESTISLKLKYDSTKYLVNKIIQPDKSEVLPNESEPLTTSSFTVKENGKHNFEVTYTELETKEVKKDMFTYEVKDILVPEVKKDVSKVEQTKKQENQQKQQKKASTSGLRKPTINGTEITDEEERNGSWQFTIIDSRKKEVAVYGFTSQKGNGETFANYEVEFEKVIVDGKMKYKMTYPDHVLYNGENYTVTQIGYEGASGGYNAATPLNDKILEIYIPDTVKSLSEAIINFDGVRYVYVPDSVEFIHNSLCSFRYDKDSKYFTTIRLPKNVSYGDNVFLNSESLDPEMIIPEDKPTFSAGEAFIYGTNLKTVGLPKSLTSLGLDSLHRNFYLETLYLWNTTQLDNKINVSTNNADAIYLVKSEKAIDLANDATYKTIYKGAGDNTIYGMVDISTTSDLTQSLKKGNTTTFAINTAKRIGNASLNDTDKFSKDWLDGSYTYSITGNSSANTVMNGDTLTVGNDETATSLKIKATSTFDTSKSVEFTINVDQTKVYVAQAIQYTAEKPNGVVVKKFETLQEAFDYNYGNVLDKSINIELLTDITLEKGVKTPSDYNDTRSIRMLTTAPSKDHKASGDPSLYTGASPDGRSVIKRGKNNKGVLLQWAIGNTSTTLVKNNISNIIFDGGRSEGLSGDALIALNSTTFNGTVLNGNNIKLFNNKNIYSHGGAIRNTSTVQVYSLELSNSLITECESILNGGAIYFTGSQWLRLKSTIINNCSSEGNGGAVYAANVTISETTIENNVASNNGGGLFITDLIYVYVGTTIRQNSAGILGSGMFMNSSELIFSGSFKEDASGNPIKVTDNAESITKGNVYFDNSSTLQVSYSFPANSEIGVTFTGFDDNGKSKMSPGAVMGKWDMNKVEMGEYHLSKRSSLPAIYRDTNGPNKGYVYADQGAFISDDPALPDNFQLLELVWPESPLSFSKVDNKDNTKVLPDAEFKLYRCNNSTHDHSSDSATTLIKDSTCWNVVKTVVSDVNGNVDFGDLSSGQYMLVETAAPDGYALPSGQWFINVNNSPNVQKPQTYSDRLSITKRGDVLPSNLDITLDDDGHFKSGMLANVSEHQLIFDVNTGSGTMNALSFTEGVTISLPSNTFTKQGFEFAGWNTSADGTGTAYADKASITNMPNASMTLYAQWKASGPSIFVDIPKDIILIDDEADGFAKQTDKVRIVKDSADEAFYPNEDILIRTGTSITLTNNISSDTFLVSVFKSDASQYLDSTSPLMTLNVKDANKQKDTFTLKTKINKSKTENLYKGFMNFIIEFRP